MYQITREEALRRWHEALRVKKEMTDRMVQQAIEHYERENGVKPKYIEVW